MNNSKFEFKMNTVSEEQLFLHLNECKSNFNPPLNEIVNLNEYSKKIIEHAVIMEAWEGGILKGCVAAYLNDYRNYVGYITNVSTTKDCFGLGIASKLMKMIISYAKEYNFKEIDLRVNRLNMPAINLYTKLNFTIVNDSCDFIEMKLTSL